MSEGRDPLGVCFLGYGLHPPWNEGTRVVTRNLMRALALDGELSVGGVSTIRPGARPSTDLDVSYVRESVVGDAVAALGGYRYNADVLMLARLGRALYGAVRSRDANVVHAGFSSHTLFSLLNDVAMDATFVAQTFGGVEHQRALRLLDTPNRIDAYVSSSRLDVEQLRAFGVPREKIHHLVPPVFVDELAPVDGATPRSRFGVDPDAFVVGYLGNVNEARLPFAVAERLNELAADPGTEALVVTKQVENPAIRSLDNLTLVTRHLSDEEKRSAYSAADAWLFPFQFDGTAAPIIDPPLTVLEAMAAARPVVATATLSLPAVIEDGVNGYLQEVGDVDGIVETIVALRDDPDGAATVGANARRTIEREFDPATVANELRSIYRRAIG